MKKTFLATLLSISCCCVLLQANNSTTNENNDSYGVRTRYIFETKDTQMKKFIKSFICDVDVLQNETSKSTKTKCTETEQITEVGLWVTPNPNGTVTVRTKEMTGLDIVPINNNTGFVTNPIFVERNTTVDFRPKYDPNEVYNK